MGGPDRRPGRLRMAAVAGAAGLAFLDAACSSGGPGKVDASASASPSRTVATAPGATRPGEATPSVSASAGTPRPTADRPLFTVPTVTGEKMNYPNCPAVAPIEAPADPGPQGVALTANKNTPGETFLTKGADATFVSANHRKRVIVDGQTETLDVNVGGTEVQYPLNDEPVIVQQNESGNALIENGSDAPLTACEKGTDALAQFKTSIAGKGIYQGPVTIVTMNPGNPGDVQITPGRI